MKSARRKNRASQRHKLFPTILPTNKPQRKNGQPTYLLPYRQPKDTPTDHLVHAHLTKCLCRHKSKCACTLQAVPPYHNAHAHSLAGAGTDLKQDGGMRWGLYSKKTVRTLNSKGGGVWWCSMYIGKTGPWIKARVPISRGRVISRYMCLHQGACACY
jgi:hypothetical protein